MQIKKVQIILNFYFPGAPDKTRTCTIISHAPEACASTISATSAVSIWCARQDLNLHGCPTDPKSAASALPPYPHGFHCNAFTQTIISVFPLSVKRNRADLFKTSDIRAVFRFLRGSRRKIKTA